MTPKIKQKEKMFSNIIVIVIVVVVVVTSSRPRRYVLWVVSRAKSGELCTSLQLCSAPFTNSGGSTESPVEGVSRGLREVQIWTAFGTRRVHR